MPRNPFINAGALVVVDKLLTLTGDACAAVRELVRDQSASPRSTSDPDVGRREARNGHRNAALAHLLAGFGNLDNDVEVVLAHYFRHVRPADELRGPGARGRLPRP